MPVFPGGELALKEYIERETKYPELAKKNGVHGQVHVSFIISKEGKVIEPKIEKGIDPAIDEEAIRVISCMPAREPGKQGGQKVNTLFTVPVNFKRED